MKNEDSIENFLYWKSPMGWPLQGAKVYVQFEVGGAYEDWGWVIEYDKKVVACHQNLQECLKMARKYFEGLS